MEGLTSNGWKGQNADYLARSNSMKTLLGQTNGTNKANGNIIVKQDSVPYYHADYYTAKEMSKRLYENKGSVTSGLVTGTQWDVMVKYLQNNNIEIDGKNCDWGNYYNVTLKDLTGYYTIDSGSTDGFKNCNNLPNNSTDGSTNTTILLSTGATEQVKRMNLYDVAGNLFEWTDEAAYYYNGSDTSLLAKTDHNTYIIRSGCYGTTSTIAPLYNRISQPAIATTGIFGFRVALYIQ